MDCPDKWESGTIMRGKHALYNIAISSLMCSTSDWFIKSTPEDSFGGGFIARNLLIVQNASARCEPMPRPGDQSVKDQLVRDLMALRQLEGEMEFTGRVYKRYDDWYRGEHQLESRRPEHEMLSTYYQRKPDHIKRLAICLHSTDCRTLNMCLDCFERALALLGWTEQFLPSLLQQMFRSATGAEQEQVLRTISSVGIIRHSELVRKLGYRMDAQRIKSILLSLKEGNMVQELNDPLFGHAYRVKGEPSGEI